MRNSWLPLRKVCNPYVISLIAVILLFPGPSNGQGPGDIDDGPPPGPFEPDPDRVTDLTFGLTCECCIYGVEPGLPCNPVYTPCAPNNACQTVRCDCDHPWNPPCVREAKNCGNSSTCTIRGCDDDTGCYSRPKCDDEDPCTDDNCDPDTGACTYVPKDCNDGNPCTTDGCNGGVCENDPKDCDDGNPCTDDECDTDTGFCSYEPKDCDDNDNCTTDGCDAGTGACVNDQTVCDDGIVCTSDKCKPADGQCEFTPEPCDPDLCGDGPVRCSNDAAPTCVAETCNIDITSEVACPGETAQLTLTLHACNPDCELTANFAITATPNNPELPPIVTSASVGCPSGTANVAIDIPQEAAAGTTYSVVVEPASTDDGPQCTANGEIVILGIDISADNNHDGLINESDDLIEESEPRYVGVNNDDDGLAPDDSDGNGERDMDENSIGDPNPAPVNGEDELVELRLVSPYTTTKDVQITFTGGIRIWNTLQNGFIQSGDVLEMGPSSSSNIFVEGLVVGPAEVTAVAVGGSCPEDKVKLQVVSATPRSGGCLHVDPFATVSQDPFSMGSDPNLLVKGNVSERDDPTFTRYVYCPAGHLTPSEHERVIFEMEGLDIQYPITHVNLDGDAMQNTVPPFVTDETSRWNVLYESVVGRSPYSRSEVRSHWTSTFPGTLGDPHWVTSPLTSPGVYIARAKRNAVQIHERRLSVVQLKFNTAETYDHPQFGQRPFVRLFESYPTIDDYIIGSPLPHTPATTLTMTGTYTSYLAPLEASNLAFGDVTPQSLVLTSTGANDQGPYTHTFTAEIEVPAHDLVVPVVATNATGRAQSAKLLSVVDLDGLGEFHSREVFFGQLVPSEVPDMPGHVFTLELSDADVLQDTVTVTFNSGIEQRTITLTRIGTSGLFRSEELLAAPQEFAPPPNTPQDATDTRIRCALGNRCDITYSVSPACTVKDRAPVIGVELVDFDSGERVSVIEAGLPHDVINEGVNKTRFKLRVGAPGFGNDGTDQKGSFINCCLTPTDLTDMPFAGLPDIPTAVYRLSDDVSDPQFNLFEGPDVPHLATTYEFLSEPTTPFVVVTPSYQGGYLRPSSGFGQVSVEGLSTPVVGEVIVNILIDGLGAGFGPLLFPSGTPNMENLLASGDLPNLRRIIGEPGSHFVSYEGSTTFPSITFSAWASWATGKDPKVHGVTGSNFYVRDLDVDPFSVSPSGMTSPIPHVSFHGPLYSIADWDIFNVYSPGTLNSAMRDSSTSPTIYEALGDVYRTAAVYHFPFRGANIAEMPTALEGWYDHHDHSGVRSDEGTTAELIQFANLDGFVLPPHVLTVYYAGLDAHTHHDDTYPLDDISDPYTGARHLIRTDRYLSKMLLLLDVHNLFERAIFTITGDHGLTKVENDDRHSLLIENWLGLDEELQAVFDATLYTVLDNALLGDSSYNAVIALNGGMAHVYLQNRAVGDWTTPPSFANDVMPVAKRFYDNSVGNVCDDSDLKGSIELVLVRNSESDPSFSAPYQVLYRTAGDSGPFLVFSLAEALVASCDGLPLVPPEYVDFSLNIDRLRDRRSGDIILMSNMTSRRTCMAPGSIGQPENGGFYFGEALEGWHGSMNDSDMTIPIIFSYPGGDDIALSRFNSVVSSTIPSSPRITDIVPTVYKLLTDEEFPCP